MASDCDVVYGRWQLQIVDEMFDGPRFLLICKLYVLSPRHLLSF